MRVVSIQAGALETRSWTVDADTELLAAYSTKIALVSSDPTLTSTDFTAPAADRTSESMICGFGSANQFLSGLKIPLSKSQVIYCAFQAAGTLLLFLEDLSA